MKKIVVDKDLGEKETFDKWNGKFLDETSYDTSSSKLQMRHRV